MVRFLPSVCVCVGLLLFTTMVYFTPCEALSLFPLSSLSGDGQHPVEGIILGVVLTPASSALAMSFITSTKQLDKLHGKVYPHSYTLHLCPLPPDLVTRAVFPSF